jgi:hypothetical protein
MPDFLGLLKVDGDELGNATLRHGNAEEPIHARHGQPMMGNDQKTRRPLLRQLFN